MFSFKTLLILLLSHSLTFASIELETVLEINSIKHESSIDLKSSKPCKIYVDKDISVEAIVSAKQNDHISVHYFISRKDSNNNWEVVCKPALLLDEGAFGAVRVTNPDEAIHIKVKAREIHP